MTVRRRMRRRRRRGSIIPFVLPKTQDGTQDVTFHIPVRRRRRKITTIVDRARRTHAPDAQLCSPPSPFLGFPFDSFNYLSVCEPPLHSKHNNNSSLKKKKKKRGSLKKKKKKKKKRSARATSVLDHLLPNNAPSYIHIL